MMIHPLLRLLFRCLGFAAFIFLLTSMDFSSAKMAGPRIVGGKPAVPGAWPFMASLFMRYGDEGREAHMCGGVIWNAETILTAAHCLVNHDPDAPGQPHPASLFRVLLGQTDISSPVPEYTFQAAHLLIHPAFNFTNFQNDVALIKLARTIDFAGAHSQAACLCDPLPVSAVNGSACLALGWGFTDSAHPVASPILMQVDLPLLPPTLCSAKYSAHYGKVYNETVNVCAGYPGVGGKDTCNADSGGPLLCSVTSHPGKVSLVGLTSFGPRDCGNKETPGFYTRVETYLGWIRQASGE